MPRKKRKVNESNDPITTNCFWNEHSSDISKTLALCNTVEHDDWTEVIRKGKSWFNSGSTPIHSKLSYYTFSQPTSNVLTDQEAVMRSRKIKLYPNTEQKVKLKRWMGTARWTYNRCVDMFNIHQELNYRLGMSTYLKDADYRNEVVNKGNYIGDPKLEWVNETPYEIRDQACTQFLLALKSAKSNFKNKNIKSFKMHFLQRKRGLGYIVIGARYWNANHSPFPTFWKPLPPLQTDQLVECNNDMKLIQVNYGWYLIVPREIKPSIPIPENQGKIISIDPGVNTFLTCYDPSTQKAFKFGHKACSQIARLLHNGDKIKAKIKTSKRRSRYRMHRAWHKLSQRIKNMIRDLHHQVARWLCNEYGSIVIGKLGQSACQRRNGSNCEKKKNRLLNCFSHYKFRNHLKYVAEVTGVKAFEVEEYYTSQLCGYCGSLNRTKKRVHHCQECGLKTDRDVNGARNILIKHLTETR